MNQGKLSHRPARTATRFKSKTKARHRPMTECRPRNGEKPIVTPSPKAAAVRFGVSWMWSSDSIHLSTALLVRCHMASEVDEACPERFQPVVPAEPNARFLRQVTDTRHLEIRPTFGGCEKAASTTFGHREEQLVVLAPGERPG